MTVRSLGVAALLFCFASCGDDTQPSPDAAMPDAPRLDGGHPDAPMIDAPMIDAPAVDAPETDAPMPDAAEPDAAAPRCNDGVRNGNETDTDCGGPDCTPCGNGQHCLVNGDCTSGNCSGNTCQ